MHYRLLISRKSSTDSRMYRVSAFAHKTVCIFFRRVCLCVCKENERARRGAAATPTRYLYEKLIKPNGLSLLISFALIPDGNGWRTVFS